jgi:branched-chain amino acid transport system ATP-binding protein
MPILKVAQLTRRFGGLVAVNQLSFAVESGEVFGLIGPNGAGKTTVFSMLTGFLRPDFGRIAFRDHSLLGLPPHRICRRGVVRTFQNMKAFPRLTIYENVLVGALARTADHKLAERNAQEALEFVGLTTTANRMPQELPIGHLKLLEMAKALAAKPELLLLDEPFAGLNPVEGAGLGELLARIHESGVTILLIEHVMRAVMALCNRVLVMHHGVKIAEGSAEQVANDSAVIDAYLGRSHAGN